MKQYHRLRMLAGLVSGIISFCFITGIWGVTGIWGITGTWGITGVSGIRGATEIWGARSCEAALAEGIIIDHTCTDIKQIPESWINKAKAEFRISYGHTSHGSQIVSGMNVLKGKVPGSLYWFDRDGTRGGLSLYDAEPSGDLGYPDRTGWAERTRALLDKPGNDRNLVMWSWCGEVSKAKEADIKTYLDLMSQLEVDYPGVTFIYMTGHLDGTGKDGNLNKRNNQIRDFCLANNKILFDFTDIESYDPDGNYYLDKGATDNCDYKNGSVMGNWATEWCAAHPTECSSCKCAHSQSLNCDLKGRAFWWMMARLAGWKPGVSASSGPDTPAISGPDIPAVSEPDTQTQPEPDIPAVPEPLAQAEPVTPAVSEPDTHGQLEPSTSALSEPAMSAVSEPGEGDPPPMSCTGDLNEDGIITPIDSLIAFQCYLRSGPCLVCTDVNQDDVVTPTDALCLFKKYLGETSCLDMTASADNAGLRERNEPFVFTGNEEQEQEGNFPEPVQTPWSIELFGHVNAKEGSWVLAYSPEDILCGKAIVKKNGLYGILHIYMDNPGTKEKEGIVAGDSIFFQVNGKMATPLGPDKAICKELSNDLIQINLEIE